MNPGPVEEVGKVASSFMDAMKTQPLALSLVIMNICLLVLFYLIMDRTDTHQREREAAARTEQKEIREMLSRCVVPSKGEAQ